MKKMARYDDNILWNYRVLVCIVVCHTIIAVAGENNEPLTACQHLRYAETRRAKALSYSANVVIPKCTKSGEFEQVQCSNEVTGMKCWCVDEYGIEIQGTQQDSENKVQCNVTSTACPASSCRMYCPSGFKRDRSSGCPVCQCRDPCEGIVCPGGLACQPQEVKCANDPCPPVPTCKKARSLGDLCPAGQPLTIADTVRPFLCGHEPGKPTCPASHKCLVQSGNDYGVCCPISFGIGKPGQCPKPDDVQSSDSTGVLCETPCSHDLECPGMSKCCYSNGCGLNCKQPFNVTICQQENMLSQLLAAERGSKGYIPKCSKTTGDFVGKQCSQNGLACWCVNPSSGHKLAEAMGPLELIDCEKLNKVIKTYKTYGKSLDYSAKCDKNICSTICEYGFKLDRNGCSTCECSEPCDGYICPTDTVCKIAKDPLCIGEICSHIPTCRRFTNLPVNKLIESSTTKHDGQGRSLDSSEKCSNETTCSLHCKYGFKIDHNGCETCECLAPCEGYVCPIDTECEEINDAECKDNNCEKIPLCKRNSGNYLSCPIGKPLLINDSIKPFVCGKTPGKPICPPMYECNAINDNVLGVCCPNYGSYKKPGECPKQDAVQSPTCGQTCAYDLSCPHYEKCCETNGCGLNCRQIGNMTACRQAQILAERLSLSEREGRGYIPVCSERNGEFTPRQCSRNGLVCWCVEPTTGAKIGGTMGPAETLTCDLITQFYGNFQRVGRILDGPEKCEKNICASICEYGFKLDHNGCSTCECSEPCEGYLCPVGSHCEVAKDPACTSESSFCSSEPLCKPDLVYSNPCEIGTPLADNVTGAVQYCYKDPAETSEFQSQSFFDSDTAEQESSRAMTNYIMCPAKYTCTKLPKESENVCCPLAETADEETESEVVELEQRSQSMCEYLRDFSDRMEGTEAGMVLALPSPTCHPDGSYEPIICQKKIIKVSSSQQRHILEEKNVRQMKMLLSQAATAGRLVKRETSQCSLSCEFGLKYDDMGAVICECQMSKTPPEGCPLRKCADCEERGYKRGADGCYTCNCQDECPLYKCAKHCEHGYEIVNECRTCTCLDKRNKRQAPSDAGEVVVEQPNQLDVQHLLRYLKQNILAKPENNEANYMAEILSRKLLNQVVQERSAKVIDNRQYGMQSLDSGFEKPKKSLSSVPFVPNENVLVEVEVDECYCVDGFGTEIPDSRGTNVTKSDCYALHEKLECLDITCRMGCDYGFILDPETKCPTCECRDPCDGVSCPDSQECRLVEVSCEGEYCPAVPACLPRKPGQCPFLVPPGTEGSTIDSCEYECRSDSHCEGQKRCCSNGCGTQCVQPQLKTACQHLQTIQLHQASELGVPARQKYIAQCDEKDGSWKQVQCGPGNTCWCIDSIGNEVSGTRTVNGQPNCDSMPKTRCTVQKCLGSCEFGYIVDEIGCQTCECRNPCNDISCPGGEQCQLMKVECIDEPCPKVPICVPKRESVCTEGMPFKRNGQELLCGPQGDAELCPSTHTCQLDVDSRKGVCCAKTRDVCFESVDASCIAESNDTIQSQAKWRFSPKQNKCVPIQVEKSCQSKNLFHSESACTSVCPVLSQCERLRLRNSLAAKRAQQSMAWFQPRCDPDTGLWSPVQCLGKQTAEAAQSARHGVGRAFTVPEPSFPSSNALGVCWCADKKGAPIKGSLTRGLEPTCNHRQARRRMSDSESISDPVIEQLINQITLIADDDNIIDDTDYDYESNPEKYTTTTVTVTERIIEIANSIFIEDTPTLKSTTQLSVSTTRCNSLKLTSFPVECDANGAFIPTQCNDVVCWCVDAAGNQLPQSNTFLPGTTKCLSVPIETVSIELHFPNTQRKRFDNLYHILKSELITLFGDVPENLQVHENIEGQIYLKFDLKDDNKVDTAFALEEMVKQNNFSLGMGELRPDLTLSRFVHRSVTPPVMQAASTLVPESTFQLIIFILATTSAFLVSIFVVFIMLKRGRNKMKSYNTNKTIGMGDKFLDYSSPIFVLSAANNQKVTQTEP